MTEEKCKICSKEPFKYTCPRCNIIYCSVACYKSQQHINCSEVFYKQCIQDELASNTENVAASKNDMQKMYNILKRIHETDAGFEAGNFEQDGLDTDDDIENADQSSIENEPDEENEDDDIAERLKDIDINDANEVWERLTLAEKEEFKKLISTGEIIKLLPDYKPWWLKNKNTKIVDISNNKDQQLGDDVPPQIFQKIPKFSSICSKEPALCLHYNLWNILAAYSCTVRYFNGEHFTNPNEATAYLVNLSSTLKYGTNFEDVDDAVVSVEMEALTTGNGASQIMSSTCTPKALLVEDRSQLQADTRNLMSNVYNKLSALSDILRLLQHTKSILKASKKGEVEFQKLFAISSGMEELTHTKIKILIKKLEFYLSFVNIELESCLK